MTASYLIVIVDDDEGLRKAVGRLLRAAGYATAAYASAEAALDAHAEERAGCMVLDIGLPGLSGLAMRTRLADQGMRPPVVFITGHDEPRLREAAEQAGAFGYLLKPFAGPDLLAAVERAVHSLTEAGIDQ